MGGSKKKATRNVFLVLSLFASLRCAVCGMRITLSEEKSPESNEKKKEIVRFYDLQTAKRGGIENRIKSEIRRHGG